MTARPLVRHFSDLLCVWAYLANARLEHVAERYAGRIAIGLHFCSVFPDARDRIAAKWAGRGGAEGYAAHVREVAGRFDHVTLHADTWTVTRPRSSTAAHLFLKAVEAADAAANDAAAPAPDEDARPLADRPAHRAAWALRRAFFAEARDISDWQVQAAAAEALGLPLAPIEAALRSGEAVARLDADMALCQRLGVTGSPTFVMNEGRQALYGNVGARLIDANVDELLRDPSPDDASWC